MGARTFSQVANASSHEFQVIVTSAAITTEFVSAVQACLDMSITVQTITGFGGTKPEIVAGVIADVTINGFVMHVDGHEDRWPLFVSWPDLWAGHTRILSNPLHDILDLARQRLVHRASTVISLNELRQRRGLHAVVS
jgi:hypothetical protein